jgi:hypothetical protein
LLDSAPLPMRSLGNGNVSCSRMRSANHDLRRRLDETELRRSRL